MKIQQNQRRAIIVGASSGIGQRLARLLLHDGWYLGVAARREAPLALLAKEFPGQVVWRCLDVTDTQAAGQLEQLVKDTGGMDLFLYASGVGMINSNLDPEPEEVTLRTNALGFTRMVGAAYRYFARYGRGHIAVITSIAGIRGLGPSPSYSATKALQSSYLEALEQQSHVRGLKIRFTDIRPGFIDTPLLHGDKFPHTLSADKASRSILKAIYCNRNVAYIDGFWHVVVMLMRLIPRALWRRMNLH